MNASTGKETPNRGEVVDLNDWATPSRTLALLCDEATAILATPLGIDDPKLPGIATRLTEALDQLATLTKPPGQTIRALRVLNNVSGHSKSEVFGAIDWFKRLASIRSNAASTHEIEPSPQPKRPARHKRKHIKGQQNMWGSE